MDLLAAYNSDEEKEDATNITHHQYPSRISETTTSNYEWRPTPKRVRHFNENTDQLQQPFIRSSTCSSFQPYVSKRQKSQQPNNVCSDDSITTSTSSTTVIGSISDAKLPRYILEMLTNKGKSTKLSNIPKKRLINLDGHTKAVNAVRWSPTHGHLLASAGLDGVACIWSPWNEMNQKKVRQFSFHAAAIKDAQWSGQGLDLLTCGYDQTSRLVDVETGNQRQVFADNQIVTVVKFYPENNNIFISGGSKGSLLLWDTRCNQVVHEFSRGPGPILDLDFNNDGNQFTCSSDVSQSNASEKSIVVWDVLTQVPLSKQVYTEAYTCPCVRYHPIEENFVAQSNGNYIAIFSSRSPFKLNKYRRFESHQVSGFPIRCNFSKNGDILVTGSADGYIYFYDFKSSKLLKRLQMSKHACIDATFHNIIPSIVASSSWDGTVSIFE